jgi:colanic acid/amylovoran biosynthesis glycosyltransferase
MSKTKLLFILYDKPDYPGGPIINYSRVLPNLVKRGYEVHVLVLYQGDFPNARKLALQGVQIYPESAIYSTQSAVQWILQEIAEIQPDVFIPDVSTPGCFAGKWAKASGIPVINSFRSDDETNWGRALYFSDAQSGFSTSAIFCVSHYLLDELMNKIDNPDLVTTVIPSGVDIPNLVHKSDNQYLSIVYAGRLIQKQKRIIETTEAFIKLATLYPDFRFSMIGDGPDKSRCQEMVTRQALDNRIFFKGMLQGEDYMNELAKYDVMVMLSDYEGMPGALMDGMACGLIPVCFAYKGVEEIVIDGVTGMLVYDRGDSLINAIVNLWDDKVLRKNLSENARKQIIGNFSLERTLNGWEELINKLLSQDAANKKHFVMPAKFKIPNEHPLLKEHYLEKNDTFFYRIRGKLKVRTRIKKLFGIK